MTRLAAKAASALSLSRVKVREPRVTVVVAAVWSVDIAVSGKRWCMGIKSGKMC